MYAKTNFVTASFEGSLGGACARNSRGIGLSLSLTCWRILAREYHHASVKGVFGTGYTPHLFSKSTESRLYPFGQE